jgi:hypothetical protein
LIEKEKVVNTLENEISYFVVAKNFFSLSYHLIEDWITAFFGSLKPKCNSSSTSQQQHNSTATQHPSFKLQRRSL